MAAQQAIDAAIAQEDTPLEDTDEKAELEAELDELLRVEATANTPTTAVAIGSAAATTASAHSKPSAAPSHSADGVSADGSASEPARPSVEGRIAVPL